MDAARLHATAQCARVGVTASCLDMPRLRRLPRRIATGPVSFFLNRGFLPKSSAGVVDGRRRFFFDLFEDRNGVR